MKITDLGHTAFRCHNIHTSLAFYAKLGIHESFRMHYENGSLMLIYLHISGDRFLEIFPDGSADISSPQRSFMHICLLVDDIKAMIEHLRANGIAIDKEVKLGLDGNLQAWINDPDGNAIEFMQLSESSAQRKIARGEKL